MVNKRHERTSELLAPHLQRGAAGSVQAGKRSESRMGSDKQKQPLARRDGLRNSGSGLPGNKINIPASAGKRVHTKPDTAETAAKLPKQTGGLDKRHEPVKPRRTTYVAPKCKSCEALSGSENYSEVYSVRNNGKTIIRYCRCRFCGSTFKDCEKS